MATGKTSKVQVIVKDKVGNNVNIGDIVTYVSSSVLKIGTVYNITEKSLCVETPDLVYNAKTCKYEPGLLKKFIPITNSDKFIVLTTKKELDELKI